MNRDTLLFAAFNDHDDADRAFRELEDHGFSAHDLSLITHEKYHSTGPLAGSMAGAAEGAATGGVLGGIAGALAGAGVIPALAGFLIGGPVAAALGLTGIAATAVSGAVTGAAAGGIVGALMGLGLSQSDAEYYERTVNEGGLLLIVPIRKRSEESEAKHILSANHATQVRLVHGAHVGA